jgi:hypothetical protein
VPLTREVTLIGVPGRLPSAHEPSELGQLLSLTVTNTFERSALHSAAECDGVSILAAAVGC